LIATIEGLREYLAIDLSSLSPKKDLLALFSWMATLRLFSGRFTLLLILSPETKRIVGSRLPLAVFGLSVEEFRAWSRPAMTFLEVAAPIDRKTLGVRPDDLVLHDARWSSKASALDDTPSVLGEMPLLSTSVHWEASCLALRRGGKGRKAAEWRTPGKNTRFVYVDNPIGLDHIDISSKTSSFFIAVSNKALFEESIFAVLDGVVDEVVWSAKPTGFAHQMLIQAAACRGVGFHGGLDRAVVASGRLPGGLINEYEAAGKETLSKLRSELPGLRQERWERATSWDPTSAEPQASDRA